MSDLDEAVEKAERARKKRSFISRLIPGKNFKNRMRQLFYKHIYYDFKVKRKQNYHVISQYMDYPFEMKFIFDSDLKYPLCKNPFADLKDGIKGYLKEYKPKKGDIIIDCGAYVGQFSILASKIVGSQGKVISLEPDPFNFNKLADNIKLNQAKNIIALNKGIWNENCQLDFVQDDHASTIGTCMNGNSDNQAISVSVITLDSLIQECNLEKVNFIKMDIEGAEIEAIQGADQLLKQFNPNLAIASYHVRNGKPTWKSLEPMLDQKGYVATTEFLGQVTTYAKKQTM